MSSAPKTNYTQVLFRPDRAIQSRELNEVQSMYAKQVKSFADHMLTNGTKVSDARSRLINYTYLLPQTQPEFVHEGMILRGRVSEQEATFIMMHGDKMCIEYNGANASGSASAFMRSETVDVFERAGPLVGSFNVVDLNDHGGVINVFVIESGTFYYNGQFIQSARQMVAIDDLSDADIGFDVVYANVSAGTDASLLDNNNNSMSNGREGADRSQTDLRLTVRPVTGYQDTTIQNTHEVIEGFINLCVIRDSVARLSSNDTSYNVIGDHIANRTYEESGNYTVNALKLTLLEHRAQSTTDDAGLSVDGDESNYAVVLGAGTAYVRGHRVDTGGDVTLVCEKSRDTHVKSGFVTLFTPRTYVVVAPTVDSSAYPNSASSAIINDGSKIGLYDGVIGGSNLPSGSKIGELTVNDVVHEKDNTYRYYVSDIVLDAGKKWIDVKSMHKSSSTFSANVPPNAVVHHASNSAMIWDTGLLATKSMRDTDEARLGSIIINKRKKMKTVVDSNGQATFKATTGEYFKEMNAGSLCVISTAGVYSSIRLTHENVTSSAEQIVVDLPTEHVGKQVTVLVDVAATNQTEKTKSIKTHVQVVEGNSGTMYSLDKSDVIEFKVWNRLSTQITTPGLWTDVTGYYTLFNGCTDSRYVNATLSRIAGMTGFPSTELNSQLVFEITYFKHTGSAGYFNVDSYTGIDYRSIPAYTDKSGNVFRLENCVDFRPLILNGVVDGVSVMPCIKSNMICDAEYYLSRIDTVCVRKDGAVMIYKGLSAESPVAADLEDDHIQLYNLHLPPYTKKLSDMVVKYVDNKRYTMRDIGRIDDRLKSSEYYVALTQLEKTAADMSIKDVNGLDRYKNGFVTDNFNTFQAADVNSGEFRAAIDASRSELRPSFKARNVKLKLIDYTGAVMKDGMAYLPSTPGIFVQQEAATTSTSINPYFVFTRRGKLTLQPNNDAWVDTINDPVFQTTIDTGTSDDLIEMGNANGNGAQLGAWTELNRTITKVDVNVSESSSWADQSAVRLNGTVITTNTGAVTGQAAAQAISGGAGGTVSVTTGGILTNTTNTATTTTFDVTRRQEFEGGVEISSRTNTYNTGKRVTNVSIIPYMRAIDISFDAINMMPGAKVYAFFNGEPVSQWCRSKTGQFGDQLKIDASGRLSGIFRVPDKTFFVGAKSFKLSGDPTGAFNE